MSRSFQKTVLTANDLLSGKVIYFTKNKNWSTGIQNAHVYSNQEFAETQKTILQSIDNSTVGIYLIEVKFENGSLIPIHNREVFRAKGPDTHESGVSNV